MFEKIKFTSILLTAVTISFCAGCAQYEPFEPKDPLMDGPGLFTGEEGKYVIEFD